jgi:ABC-type branched-subunit amino acid transport system permease subunit
MRGRYLQLLGFTGLIVAIQLATQLTGNPYHLTQLTMSAYYSLLVIGLCLLIGYAGQISIGHAGFFAIGGYLSALLTTHDLERGLQIGRRMALLIRGQIAYRMEAGGVGSSTQGVELERFREEYRRRTAARVAER